MGLIDLLKAKQRISCFKTEAEQVLRELIGKSDDLSTVYEKWRKTFRLNTVACSAFTAYNFCEFEGTEFDEVKRRRVYVASATACIADDLMDSPACPDARQYYLFDIQQDEQVISTTENLFYFFHTELEKLAGDSFASRQSVLIKRFNKVQEAGSKLNKGMDKDEVIRVKDGTGGYSALLLYAITLPESDALPVDFIPQYNLMIPPSTKSHAIFNYGAFLSRLDDLNDKYWDRSEGRISLASEGHISWSSLQQDIDYLRTGLSQFYPIIRVNDVMSIFTVNSMRFTFGVTNTVARMKQFIGSG